MASSVIGLDIGTSSVRAAQLSATKGSVRLDALGQVALPEGAVRDGRVMDQPTVTQALRDLWKHSRLTGKRIALGVASSRVIVRQVDLPWLPPAELKQSLAFSVGDWLPMAVEDVYLDFCTLEEVTIDDARLVRGLLVAAPRDLISANLEAVLQAGLKPVAVDLAPFAVLRTVGTGGSQAHVDPVYSSAGFAGETGVEALVEIGAGVTTVIVHEHGIPRFVRIVPMGGQGVTDAVAERLGIDRANAETLKQELSQLGMLREVRDGSGRPADPSTVSRAIDGSLSTFITEIRGSLDFYAASEGSLPIDRVVLTGGGARLRGLPQRLAEVLPAPITPGAPFAGVRIGDTGLSNDQLDFLAALSAVPIGLALGALA